MKRKVIQHGPGTVIISLPSKWVKKHGIRKGSELNVSEEGNNIVISSEENETFDEVSVDITGLDRSSIMHVIRGLYRLGYDKVNVRFDNPAVEYQREKKTLSTLSVIHQETGRLIGFEIIQEREKSCMINALHTTSTRDFDNVLRRVFLLLNDMMGDFVKGVKTGDASLLETIENKHDTITKFVSYCLRILNKKSHTGPKKTGYYYHIIALLDRITDIIKYAARDAIKEKKAFAPASVKILETVSRQVKNYYELFYSYSNKKVVEINSARYVAEKAAKSLPKNISRAENMIVISVYQILEMILDLIEARAAINY